MPITLRPDLADLEPYDPDMRPAKVILTANENNYGLPDEVHAAVAKALAQVPTNRYPDATSPDLRRELGRMWGVPARDIVVGNGGDEIIFNLLLGFGGPGRALVTCTPTFSAYELYAQLTQTPVVRVPRTPSFDVDEDAVRAAAREAGLVIICSPNNPSGNVVRPGFVDELACQTDALIMIDEAYGEFAEENSTCVPLVARHENVCVLRTLSKAYALAGARVGYLIASPAVADGMLSVRLPYSVNRFSQVAAQVVVERRAELAGITRAIVEERPRLIARLQDVAEKLAAAGTARMDVFPSQANFVMMRIALTDAGRACGTPDAHEIHELLAEKGILVRDFSRAPGSEGCLRISVGTPTETDEFIAALQDVLGLSGAGDAPGDEPETSER